MVFQPASLDFEILMNSGNTDGWCKVVRMLCEPGDFILVEQYTYSSSQARWIPMGCIGVPIKSDSQEWSLDTSRGQAGFSELGTNQSRGEETALVKFSLTKSYFPNSDDGLGSAWSQ
jgi:hypothetical protein